MSRSRRFLHGIGVSYVQQAIMLVCGLWLTAFLLRGLGTEEYGGWLIVLQLLAYFDLVDLGVIALLPREVAYASGRAERPEERAAAAAVALGRVWRLLLTQLPLIAAAAAFFWVCAGGLSTANAVPLAVLALLYVTLFPFRVYQAALQGLQDLAALGWIVTLGWLLQMSVTLALVLAGHGFWGLTAGWASNRVAVALLCRLRLGRTFPAIFAPAQAQPTAGEARRLLGSGLWVTVGRVAQILLNGTEVVVLAAMLGPAAVVVYTCTAKLAAVLGPQLFQLALAAEPGLSELRTGGDEARLARASLALGQLVALTTGLVACVLLATNEGFVTSWVGAERYGGLPLTAALLGVLVVRNVAFALGRILFCLGYERALALVGLGDGLVTLAAMFLLVPLMGRVGAAVGSLVGVGVVFLPASLYLLKQAPETSRLPALAPYLPWLWRFLTLAGALAALSCVWVPSNFVSVCATGLAAAVLYALVMWGVLRRSALWPYAEPLVVSLKSKAARVLWRPNSGQKVTGEVPVPLGAKQAPLLLPPRS